MDKNNLSSKICGGGGASSGRNKVKKTLLAFLLSILLVVSAFFIAFSAPIQARQTGGVSSVNAIVSTQEENALAVSAATTSPAPASTVNLSTTPLFTNTGAINIIATGALATALIENGHDINSTATQTQATLNSWFGGNLMLFENYADLPLTTQLWQPVFLRGNILTLWIQRGYYSINANSMPRARVYENSIQRELILQHANALVAQRGGTNGDFRQAVVLPQDALDNMDIVHSGNVTSGTARSAVPISIFGTDLVFQPSAGEIINGGLWGFSSDGQRIAAGHRPGLTGSQPRTLVRHNSTGDTVSLLQTGAVAQIGAAGGSGPWWRQLRPAIHIDISSFFNEHTVIFSCAQGASGASGSQEAIRGATLTRPADPSLIGHNFQGWSTVAYGTPMLGPGGNPLLDGEGNPVMAPRPLWNFASDRLVEDTILHTVWQRQSFTVNFNLQGGGPFIPNQSILHGNPVIRPPVTPNLQGHSFAHWATTPNGDQPFGFLYSFQTVQNFTLYAVWDYERFLVTFDLVGGDGVAPAPQQVRWGEFVVQPDDPYISGNTFLHWATAIGGPDFFAADEPVTARLPLYAVWETPFDIATITFIIEHAQLTDTIEITQTVAAGSAVNLPQSVIDAVLPLGLYITDWRTAADESFTFGSIANNSFNLYAVVQTGPGGTPGPCGYYPCICATITPFETPVVSISDGSATWGAIAEASGYQVRIFRGATQMLVETVIAPNTSFNLTAQDLEDGNYRVEVVAVGARPSSNAGSANFHVLNGIVLPGHNENLVINKDPLIALVVLVRGHIDANGGSWTSRYTISSATTIISALYWADAVLENENATQTAINGAYSGLRAAFEGRALKGSTAIDDDIDKAALLALVESVITHMTANPTSYRLSSINAINSAVSAAITVLMDKYAQQPDVDTMYTVLSAVFNARVVFVPGTCPEDEDPTGGGTIGTARGLLLAEIIRVSAYINANGENYTDGSVASIMIALQNAISVHGNISATQAQLNAARISLTQAYGNRVLRGNPPTSPPDRNALRAAIQRAEGRLANSYRYTTFSLINLDGALQQARAVYLCDYSWQVDINNATAMLNSFIDALRRIDDEYGNGGRRGGVLAGWWWAHNIWPGLPWILFVALPLLLLIAIAVIIGVIAAKKRKGQQGEEISTEDLERLADLRIKARDAVNKAFSELKYAGECVTYCDSYCSQETEKTAMDQLVVTDKAMLNAEKCVTLFLAEKTAQKNRQEGSKKKKKKAETSAASN